MMHVSKTIEMADGSIKFEGDLTQMEVDLVLTAGLNFLFMKGALPFQVVKETQQASVVVSGSEEIQ